MTTKNQLKQLLFSASMFFMYLFCVVVTAIYVVWLNYMTHIISLWLLLTVAVLLVALCMELYLFTKYTILIKYQLVSYIKSICSNQIEWINHHRFERIFSSSKELLKSIKKNNNSWSQAREVLNATYHFSRNLFVGVSIRKLNRIKNLVSTICPQVEDIYLDKRYHKLDENDVEEVLFECLRIQYRVGSEILTETINLFVIH